MKNDLINILKISVNAPSGDNSQPWKFSIKDNQINIYNISDADPTLYNFQQRGSYIAHGALIENILICAQELGFKTSVKLLANQNTEHIAKIIFHKTEPVHNPLFNFIKTRSTNRKPYEKTPLANEQKQKLLNLNKYYTSSQLYLTSEKQNIINIAKTISLNERLILENKKIHQTLFSFIRWTEEEEQEKMDGLYIKTLELAPPQEKAFKIFSNWSVLKYLNKINIGKLIAKDTAKLYAKSGAFGLIVTNDDAPESYIQIGSLLQEIWLTVSQLNLSLQPVTALLYLNQRIKSGDTEHFTQDQIELIQQANQNIERTFDIKQGTPAMLFRVGQADQPSAKSIKKLPLLIK